MPVLIRVRVIWWLTATTTSIWGFIYECLIILQSTRLKNFYTCEGCEVFNKEVSIKLTGFENYDRLQINNIKQ